MQGQPESFYGTILAVAGFAVWTLFSLLPTMSGGNIREAWDLPMYWVLGVPLLLGLHAFVGAQVEENTWRLPLWAIGGHIAGMMLVHPTGPGLALFPMAVFYVGIPMYIILLLAALSGRTLARGFGSA